MEGGTWIDKWWMEELRRSSTVDWEDNVCGLGRVLIEEGSVYRGGEGRSVERDEDRMTLQNKSGEEQSRAARCGARGGGVGVRRRAGRMNQREDEER